MRNMTTAAPYPPPVMVNNPSNMNKRRGDVNRRQFEINEFIFFFPAEDRRSAPPDVFPARNSAPENEAGCG